jgi:hypothetical protein
LCRSFDQLCELKSIAAINLLYTQAIDEKFLNTTLIEAVTDVLEDFDIPVRCCVDKLVIKEHAVKACGLNVVDPVYSTGSFARPLVDRRPAYYKAMSKYTSFPVVCDESRLLNFALTVKAPGASPDQTISLRLNGGSLAEIPVTAGWTTSTFSAPATLLHAGLNQIEIRWPMPTWSREEWTAHVAECLDAGESVEITPIFGLIHSFRVFL